MRHTRQRQLKKVNGIVENNRIDLLNKFNPSLDKSFEWNREYNWWRTKLVNWITFERNLDLVGFNGRNTAIIPVKKGEGTKTIQK